MTVYHSQVFLWEFDLALSVLFQFADKSDTELEVGFPAINLIDPVLF